MNLNLNLNYIEEPMSALVDSTMLYGVEIRGCMRNLESIEQA